MGGDYIACAPIASITYMSSIAKLMAMVFLADGSSGSKPLKDLMLGKSGSVAQSTGM